MGRRIQKLVAAYNGSAYTNAYTNRFVYDGWNLLAEVNPAGSLVRGYLWGSDLSGSMQGAGGIGGLLEVSYYGGSTTTNCFVARDGNGNIAGLIYAAAGTNLANYDYGPFGELIRMTGPMAKLNPFRFSTKYEDDESGLDYYGYRYYNPSTGRWPSRDPIGEPGFEVSRKPSRKSASIQPDLYLFVHNDAVNRADFHGLCCCDAATIAKQMQDLLGRYALAENHLEGRNIPRGQGHWSDYSCANINGAIGNFMAPSPFCWRCRLQELEEKWIWPSLPQNDHWVIICNSTPASAFSVQTITFDYWGNGSGQAGYPNISDQPAVYYDHAPDCNTPWKADYDWLDVLPPYELLWPIQGPA